MNSTRAAVNDYSTIVPYDFGNGIQIADFDKRLLDAFWCGDYKSALVIEEASFGCPWEQADFHSPDPNEIRLAMRVPVRKRMGEVLVDQMVLAGYIYYSVDDKHVTINNLAIHPLFRRAGLGRELVQFVIDRLVGGPVGSLDADPTSDPEILSRYKSITVLVDVENLLGSLFFKNLGFHCVGEEPFSGEGGFYENVVQYRFVMLGGKTLEGERRGQK